MDFIGNYKVYLGQLVNTDRNRINLLRELAKENQAKAAAIVDTIVSHIKTVSRAFADFHHGSLICIY